jgi:hypothetical protein
MITPAKAMRLPRQVLWRALVLVALPLVVWGATDGHYRLINETAGGIHFTTKVNRFDADDACLILLAGDETPNLKPYQCRKGT